MGWVACSREDPAAFVRSNWPPLARRKISELERADADAHETEGRMANGGGHAPDLAVPAFDQFKFQPAIRDVLPEADGRLPRGHCGLWFQELHAAGAGAVSLDRHAGGELDEGVGRRDPFDLTPVGAGMSILGVEEPAVEAGFVAQEEKTLGIRIQTAQCIDARGKAKAIERTVRRTVRSELAENAVGLVEGNQHGCGSQTISPRIRRTVTSWVTRVLAIMLSGRMPRHVELG